jgi:hypothetical protein
MGGSIRKVTGLVDFKPETAAVQPETPPFRVQSISR